jgi:Ala-tRNA(Pro) deacylase
LEAVSRLLGDADVQLASEAEIAEHCPDCELGALPPFGSRYGMKTIVDESLAQDEAIVFEGNTHNEAIQMRFDAYRRLEEPMVARFAV